MAYPGQPSTPQRPATTRATGSEIAGKTFVFTGRMDAMKREDAHDLVRSLGGYCEDAVRIGVDYLVTGARVGARKTQAARDLGTVVIDQYAFNAMLPPGATYVDRDGNRCTV
jgi:DNA ligase (NAD+)